MSCFNFTGVSWEELRRLWRKTYRCYCDDPKCIYNYRN